MALEVVQNFGTGGSPSAEVTGSGQSVTLTGSWAAFAVTFSVPSITGKTLGTNGDDYLALNFWTSAGSTFNTRAASLGIQTINVDLWGIHIKLGTHTTAAVDLYKAPELGPELARCQRYYQPAGKGATGRTISATSLDLLGSFVGMMRASPSLSFGGFTGATATISQLGVGDVTATGIGSFNAGRNGFWVNLTTSGATGGSITGAIAGDFIAADAEL